MTSRRRSSRIGRILGAGRAVSWLNRVARCGTRRRFRTFPITASCGTHLEGDDPDRAIADVVDSFGRRGVPSSSGGSTRAAIRPIS